MNMDLLGIRESYVRDEKWGDWTDSEHLPDGGLQVGQITSVVNLGVPVPPDLGV